MFFKRKRKNATPTVETPREARSGPSPIDLKNGVTVLDWLRAKNSGRAVLVPQNRVARQFGHSRDGAIQGSIEITALRIARGHDGNARSGYWPRGRLFQFRGRAPRNRRR